MNDSRWVFRGKGQGQGITLEGFYLNIPEVSTMFYYHAECFPYQLFHIFKDHCLKAGSLMLKATEIGADV